MKCYGVDGEPCVKNVGTSTEIGNQTFEKELHYPNLSKLNLKLVVLVISRRARVSGVLLHFYVLEGLWNREHLQPMLQTDGQTC